MGVYQTGCSDTYTRKHDISLFRLLLWRRQYIISLQWRHNGCDSASNHQPHDCLLNGLLRRRSKKTWKLCVTGLCAGIHRGPVNSPHKWPVTRKMFPFDDVTMIPLYTPKLILNWNVAKYHSSIVLISDMESFCNFAESTTVSKPCLLQNLKTIPQLRKRLFTNEISRDFSLKWVSL